MAPDAKMKPKTGASIPNIRPCPRTNLKNKHARTRILERFLAFRLWQGQKDSNPRHAVLETAALPAELYPYVKTEWGFPGGVHRTPPGAWWAFRDSNPGPTGYEPAALTN